MTNLFQRFGKKTVEAVKTAAMETTKEDADDALDILERTLKIVAVLGITIAAVKGASRRVPAIYDIPAPVESAQPVKVINVFMTPGREVIV